MDRWRCGRAYVGVVSSRHTALRVMSLRLWQASAKPKWDGSKHRSTTLGVWESGCDSKAVAPSLKQERGAVKYTVKWGFKLVFILVLANSHLSVWYLSYIQGTFYPGCMRFVSVIPSCVSVVSHS